MDDNVMNSSGDERANTIRPTNEENEERCGLRRDSVSPVPAPDMKTLRGRVCSSDGGLVRRELFFALTQSLPPHRSRQWIGRRGAALANRPCDDRRFRITHLTGAAVPVVILVTAGRASPHTLLMTWVKAAHTQTHTHKHVSSEKNLQPQAGQWMLGGGE
jgi:hypothetical protein